MKSRETNKARSVRLFVSYSVQKAASRAKGEGERGRSSAVARHKTKSRGPMGQGDPG